MVREVEVDLEREHVEYISEEGHQDVVGEEEASDSLASEDPYVGQDRVLDREEALVWDLDRCTFLVPSLVGGGQEVE